MTCQTLMSPCLLKPIPYVFIPFLSGGSKWREEDLGHTWQCLGIFLALCLGFAPGDTQETIRLRVSNLDLSYAWPVLG